MSELAQTADLPLWNDPHIADYAQASQSIFGVAFQARGLARRVRNPSDWQHDAQAISKAMDALDLSDASNAVLRAAAAIYAGALVEIYGRTARDNALCIAALARGLVQPGLHLATRDEDSATAMMARLSPAARQLGITLGIVGVNAPFAERQQAYRAHIAIVSAHSLASDILRDRHLNGMRRSPLALKLRRLKRRQPDVLTLNLNNVILADVDTILLDDARQPIVLHDTALASVSPDEAKQALGLAKLFDWDRDIDHNHQAIKLNGHGEAIVARAGHLYPDISLDTSVGLAKLLDAISVLHDYAQGQHYDIDDGRIVPQSQPDGAMIGIVDAIPYLEAQHELDQTPRALPVARASLQRTFARYHSVSGAGIGIMTFRKELLRLYAVKGPLRIKRPLYPASAIRGVNGFAAVEAYVGKMLQEHGSGLAIVMPPDPNQVQAIEQVIQQSETHQDPLIVYPDQPNAAPDAKADVLLFLTPPSSRSEDARQLEALSLRPSRIVRVLDMSTTPLLAWPRGLRKAVTGLPFQALRDLVLSYINAVAQAYVARQNSQVRLGLRRYDQQLDKMLSFTGDDQL